VLTTRVKDLQSDRQWQPPLVDRNNRVGEQATTNKGRPSFGPQVTGLTVEASTGSRSLSDARVVRELKSAVHPIMLLISTTASCQEIDRWKKTIDEQETRRTFIKGSETIDAVDQCTCTAQCCKNRANSGRPVVTLCCWTLANVTECTVMELHTQIEGVFRSQRQREQDEVCHQCHC